MIYSIHQPMPKLKHLYLCFETNTHILLTHAQSTPFHPIQFHPIPSNSILSHSSLTIQLQTSPPKPTLSRQQQQQQPILTPAPAPTPPAPPTMALRLSAAYLVGLSRILNQQYTYTLTDTSKLHSSIVAAFNSSSSSSAASLTMLAPEARFDAITLQTDLGGGADGDGGELRESE